MTPDDSAEQLKQRKRMHAVETFITRASELDELLSGTQSRVQELFAADRTTIYALDTSNRQLYSPAKGSGGEFKEIRVGLDCASITGFVGVAKKTVNIANVYEAGELQRIHPELQFDDRWDKASGFLTRSVLCVPVLYESNLLGTIQVINRKDGQPFAPRDVAAAEEIGRSLGLAFYHLNRIKALEGRKPGKWDALIDAGLVSEVDLTRALGEAAGQKADPARHLMDKMGIARAEIDRSLALFYNCESFRFTGVEVIPEEYRKRVRVDYFRRNGGAPVERRSNTLVVVVDDPNDLHRVDALRAIEPGVRMELRVGLHDEILAMIDHSYGLTQHVGAILKELTQEAKPGAASHDDDDETKMVESDSAVIKLANQIISDAYRRNASDIHIEPYGKERNTRVRFRIDGDCVRYQEIPPPYRHALVARFKIMANLDISEKRKPQDGKILLKINKETSVELRVATLPTANGNEDVVMRILAASAPLPLDQMGMSERNLAALKSIITKPYGLILCVGPTGSGKTTTVHSALGHINTDDMKILTAEDPVEITQIGLRQVQVQPKIGFTFAAAIRAFLRADPDVILVGEMRDRETAEIGIEASLTGHLVLSTLHTNSAAETVTRLIDMGLDPFSFADALLGVLAQRLARSLCRSCREPYRATRAEFDELAELMGAEALAAQGIEFGPEFQLWRGRGCEQCGNSGYRGRCALHELLMNDDLTKRAIARRAPVEDVRQLAIAGGMTTLLQDGIQKAIIGKTDLKQVLAVCSR